MADLVRIVDTQGYAYETLTVTSATIGRLTATKYLPNNASFAQKAVISVETDTIRYMYDGLTTVATTVGHSLGSTGVLVISGIQNITNLRILAVSATATLQVTYER